MSIFKPAETWDDLISAQEKFCLERHVGYFHLRSGHPYYCQLIALLGILDLPWIEICIMKKEDIDIERFINDENLWFTVTGKLTAFYFRVGVLFPRPPTDLHTHTLSED
jgi:hypothetical protein